MGQYLLGIKVQFMDHRIHRAKSSTNIGIGKRLLSIVQQPNNFQLKINLFPLIVLWLLITRNSLIVL